MALTYDVHNEGDVIILRLSGKITIGEGDAELSRSVRDQLGRGVTKLILDLDQVTSIDSSGIGELVAATTTTTNKGGSLKLLRVPSRVHDLLTVTQLITFFEVFDDEDVAVKSFA
ncbi:STAS domain-containing protein [Streptomyces albidoflavus]